MITIGESLICVWQIPYPTTVAINGRHRIDVYNSDTKHILFFEKLTSPYNQWRYEIKIRHFCLSSNEGMIGPYERTA